MRNEITKMAWFEGIGAGASENHGKNVSYSHIDSIYISQIRVYICLALHTDIQRLEGNVWMGSLSV